MQTNIEVTKNNHSVIPRGIVESKLRASQYQIDILAIILAEIGKDTDKDDNLAYTITADDFATLKDITDKKEAARILREYICGEDKNSESMRHIGFELWFDKDDFRHYNWFEKITYTKGTATFYLTSDIKQFLVEFKKNDSTKVYAKLRYILPMKSRYSKRIYLMCREFLGKTGAGKRYCDTDWEVFLEKLQIPTSYRYARIKASILDVAVAEINELSDITISYEIKEVAVQKGKRPIAIVFDIHSKSEIEAIVETESTVLEEENNLEELSTEEIEKRMQQMAEILKKRKED